MSAAIGTGDTVDELRAFGRLGTRALAYHAGTLPDGLAGTAIRALLRSCGRALQLIAAAGGPSEDQHLDDLRRGLLRRRTGLQRRAEVDRTVGLIRGTVRGTEPMHVTAGPERVTARDLRLLVDLVELDRVLATAVRVGRVV